MKFYPKEHKYIHNKKEYLSCTTLIKKMFPKFEKSRISKQYAIKNNLKKKDVLKQWKLTGKQASIVGTIVHKIAEDLINKKYKTTQKYIQKYKQKHDLTENQIKKIKDLTLNVKNLIKKLPIKNPTSKTVLTETILWDEKTLISGTVDLIIINPNTPSTVYILDWKTSKTISRVPFNIMDKDIMGLCIPHANYYHYSMQMAVYQHLMQTTPETKKLLTPLKHNIKFKHGIIHIPSESIIWIPDKEIKNNQVYVQKILKNFRAK